MADAQAGDDIRLENLVGDAIQPALADVARLRIDVFREWPYLYDGTLEYERGYLSGFARAKDGLIVTARHGATIVGAATAAPLGSHTTGFVGLFEAHGCDPERVFYLGESVLLPAYRGRGLGHSFFDRREAFAARCSGAKGAFTHIAFCAVQRQPGDRRMPVGYRPLDAFWMKRGYRPVPDLVGAYAWKEIGGAGETANPMQFWMRTL